MAKRTDRVPLLGDGLSATLGEIADLAGGGSDLAPVTVEFTGDWLSDVAFVSSSPFVVFIPRTDETYSAPGSWLAGFGNGDMGLTTLTLPDVVGVYVFNPSSTTLETFNLPALKMSPNGVALSQLSALTSLDVSVLEYSGEINLGASPLPNLSLPALIRAGGIIANGAGIVTLEAPLLKYGGDAVHLLTCADLTTLDFSALQVIDGSLSIVDCNSLVTASFPALETAEGVALNGCDSLVTASFSVLQNIGGSVTIAACPLLTSLTLNALLEVAGDVNVGDTVVDQTSVNALLVKLAALDGAAGTTTYDGHQINIPISATGAGVAAQTTLEGRGNTVVVGP